MPRCVALAVIALGDLAAVEAGPRVSQLGNAVGFRTNEIGGRRPATMRAPLVTLRLQMASVRWPDRD